MLDGLVNFIEKYPTDTHDFVASSCPQSEEQEQAKQE